MEFSDDNTEQWHHKILPESDTEFGGTEPRGTWLTGTVLSVENGELIVRFDNYGTEGSEPPYYENSGVGELLPDEYAEHVEPLDSTENDVAVSAAFDTVEMVRLLPRKIGLIPFHGEEDARAYAEYGEALTGIGLSIEARYPDVFGYDTSVKKRDIGAQPAISDPGAFTAALAGVSSESIAAEHVRIESGDIVGRTLDRASTIVYRSRFEEVRRPFGNKVYNPKLDIRPDIVQAPAEPDAAQLEFIDQLGATASLLGAELERLDAPEQTVAAMESLAIAHKENMITDWARMYVTQVVGHGELAIGQRFHGDERWDAIEPILTDLRDRAPDSRFTQYVHDTLKTQLATAIGEMNDPAQSSMTDGEWELLGLSRALEVIDRIWPSGRDTAA